MKTLLFITSVILFTGARAQVFPVQANILITPPYSPYLSDYTVPGAQNFTIHIRLGDITVTEYPCRLRITIEGPGVTLRTKNNYASPPLMLQGGGIPQTFYGEDIHEYFHPDALDFSGLSRTEYQKTARLPEGIYRFSVEVLDYNRGTVVSNKAMATAWVIVNNPPILNLPANFSKLSVQDPVNILFTWTPRHSGSPNAAFTTEYTFRLIELWPENRNPYDAFLTQAALFETVTDQNQMVYGVSEPSLLPGRKYAWQIEARDREGRDLFKNNGRSEVFVFQYGEALPVPGNLRMRWAKPTTLAIQWDPVDRTGDEVRYRLKYRPRGRRENHEWYETWTRFTDKTLYNLQTNTAYEMQIRAENTMQESDYSEMRIFKTLREEVAKFVCKEEVDPPPLPANTLPVFPVSVNDTIHAGGYNILVRDVMKVGSKYYGSGVAIVPWFNGAKVRVTFENIGVNDRFWLTSGTIKSVWTPEGALLLEEQTPITPGNAPQTGELDITVVTTDSLVTVEGSAIASVTINESGDIMVTTTDGRQEILSKGESYAITDETGNGYVVDEKGNIAKTTAQEATATATRGNRAYDLRLVFTKGNARFGFDEKRFEALSQYYQQLDNGTYVSWKALSSSRPDVIQATLVSRGIDADHIRFEAGATPVVPTSTENGVMTLNVQGKAAGMEEELLALFTPADTVPPKVVGKVNLVTYNPIHYSIEIIPVNGASLPDGLDAENISQSLNAVYSQAVVAWDVRVANGLIVDLPETFDEGETGVFANYTADMKKVLNAHGDLRDNTYYLFVIAQPRNGTTLGYMPRNRQAGFVFAGPHAGNGPAFLKTIAHELGHGAFNLKHTFSEHNVPAGTTDNVMDYSNGTVLFKYQWDHIHEPHAVLGLFEGNEEAKMNSDLVQVEAEFLRRFGSEYQKLTCWGQGIQRYYEVRGKFEDEDLAFYAGFLRMTLCATEKENCDNDVSPYACGLINGLCQEIDWITMLESVEGWSADPEELLLCVMNSFSIGGEPDNKLTLERVLFKCLVGVDIDGLVDGIREFIIENWEEPYYQGQATAFALTLLSPFKGKVLTKLEKMPQYARKLDSFKFLAKAKNKEELVGMVKLVDENHLETLGKTVKYLPGPQLPQRIAATFTNSVYTNRKLLNSERFFKYHGVNNRTGKKYTWVVNKKYSDEMGLRGGLAIRDDWNVDIKYVSEFDVPKGTWISEGTAASQGLGYPGGHYQAVILNVPENWIIKTNNAF